MRRRQIRVFMTEEEFMNVVQCMDIMQYNELPYFVDKCIGEAINDIKKLGYYKRSDINFIRGEVKNKAYFILINKKMHSELKSLLNNNNITLGICVKDILLYYPMMICDSNREKILKYSVSRLISKIDKKVGV